MRTRRIVPGLLVLLAAACQVKTTPPVASPPSSAEALGQARCGVRKSADKPLVVEWPAAERAALESRAGQGLVAVRYEGCEMEVLSHCDVPGEYAYVGLTTKRESVRIRNADELYARLPVGAASLEAQLERSGQLNVDLTVVGRKEASLYEVSRYDLKGSCEGATHFVAGLTVGAFSMYTGKEIGGGGGIEVASAGVGGSRTKTQETLRDDGDPAACSAAKGDDASPPAGCAALLRVEVLPLSESVARTEPIDVPEPAEPAGPPEPAMPEIDPSQPMAPTPLVAEADPLDGDPCAIDFEIVKISRKRADPPFHDRAMDRVTLKISNRGNEAVRLDGGSDALFLDANKNILTADVGGDFFMPRRLPAGSSAVVRILMRRHTAKTLRTIEIGATPVDRPFAKCRVVDSELAPAPAWAPKEDAEIRKMPLPAKRPPKVQCPAGRAKGVYGTVVFEVDIRRDGTIRATHLVKGIGSGCDEVARGAIEQATFTPAKDADGNPVDYAGLRYEYQFVAPAD